LAILIFFNRLLLMIGMFRNFRSKKEILCLPRIKRADLPQLEYKALHLPLIERAL
jgi:hypothetical protein